MELRCFNQMVFDCIADHIHSERAREMFNYIYGAFEGLAIGFAFNWVMLLALNSLGKIEIIKKY